MVHDNPAWAYDNDLLRHHNTLDTATGYHTRMKEKKTKACKHTVTYYNARIGDFVCQFCGKAIGSLKMGKSKKAEPYKKKHSKKSSSSASKKKKTTKMGFEAADPRIKQAEAFKKQRFVLKMKLGKAKKAKDKDLVKDLTEQLAELDMDMRALHRDMNPED